MNKTAQTELRRVFLLDALPEPLTRASSHLQIFDNYVENTRMRLRLVRDPQENSWTRILQQRFFPNENDLGAAKIAEIYLNEKEYALFERFEGREIRKNRYFHEFDGRQIAFDVFLGDLWGLNLARVDFDKHDDMLAFEPPPFAVFEVTSDAFFLGSNLVGKKFESVQTEVAKIGLNEPAVRHANEE